jgi:kumamolisin
MTATRLVPLPGSERDIPLGSKRIGILDHNAVVAFTIVIRSHLGSPPLPDHEYWMQTPPAQRHYLTVDEFTETYGASESDMRQVIVFARDHELTVGTAHLGRRILTLQAKAAQINEMFGIELIECELPLMGGRAEYSDGESDQENGGRKSRLCRTFEGPLHIPEDLADVIEAVFGLDTRRHMRPGGNIGPGANVDPANTQAMAIPQQAQHYNFPNTGAAGQTIGFFDAGGKYSNADMESYITWVKTPTTAVPPGLGMPTYGQAPSAYVEVDLTIGTTTFSNQGNPNSNNGGDLEISADQQIAATTGQGATIAVYCTEDGDENGWLAFITAAVLPDSGQPTPSVLSASWCLWIDDNLASGTVDTLSIWFRAAAIRGITVLVGAGDWGSNSGALGGKCHVEFPASDPWVTSCGGTVFAAEPGPPPSIEENVWNESANNVHNVGKGGQTDYATGGGVSIYFTQLPPWQADVEALRSDVGVSAVPAGRAIPDIAGNAALASILYDVFVGANANGFYGTSAVAPLYAGLIATLNESLGYQIGFLNPILYFYGDQICNDVTLGNNDPEDGSGAPYFEATAGWDACTGWGSIDGTKLYNTLANPAAPANVDMSHFSDSSINHPSGIAVGPDNAIWFTNFVGNSIGRVTTADTPGAGGVAGTFTNFSDPRIDEPAGIAAGNDNALWFTSGGRTVGRFDLGTQAFSFFSDPAILYPQGITLGPDGAMWFTNEGNNSIDRITTSATPSASGAGIVTSYSDPGNSDPQQIVTGSDLAMWVTNEFSSTIARLTTTSTAGAGGVGGVLTILAGSGTLEPFGIVAGPDEAIWFTNFENGSIGRIAPGTSIVENYPGTASAPYGITAGPDGAMWYCNQGTNTIGRIPVDQSTPQSPTFYPGASQPVFIVTGPDGALWFTEQSSNSIGRIAL